MFSIIIFKEKVELFIILMGKCLLFATFPKKKTRLWRKFVKSYAILYKFRENIKLSIIFLRKEMLFTIFMEKIITIRHFSFEKPLCKEN